MKSFFEKCKERCDRLMKITLHINQTYMVLLQIRDLRLQKHDVFIKSPAFYQTVFKNCTIVIFIELCKMYDFNPESEGLYALLQKMLNNIVLLDGNYQIEANKFINLTDDRAEVVHYHSIELLLHDSIDQIKLHKDVLSRLWTLRDKYYAHYEIMTEEKLDCLLKSNRISYEDLNQLIMLNMNIINALYKYFFDATMLPLLANYDDLDSTICCVEKVEEERQMRLQRLQELTKQERG